MMLVTGPSLLRFAYYLFLLSLNLVVCFETHRCSKTYRYIVQHVLTPHTLFGMRTCSLRTLNHRHILLLGRSCYCTSLRPHLLFARDIHKDLKEIRQSK